MPKTAEKYTERVQVMLTPEEFDFLQGYASALDITVEELIRELIENSVFGDAERMKKLRALRELFSIEGAPVPDWEEMERQVESRWMEPPEAI